MKSGKLATKGVARLRAGACANYDGRFAPCVDLGRADEAGVGSYANVPRAASGRALLLDFASPPAPTSSAKNGCSRTEVKQARRLQDQVDGALSAAASRRSSRP